MLGLAASLAEDGWAALAIDNCGHGENTAAIGTGWCRKWKRP